MRTGPDWRNWAACRGTGIDFFSELVAVERIAISICHSCPVRWECLDQAHVDEEMFGVFGGLTALQRRQGRRRYYKLNRQKGTVCVL